MNDDSKVLKIWISAICIVIASFSGCTMQIAHDDNEAMKAMVASGADPIDARCGVKGSGRHDAVCDIRAATKNK